MKRCPRCKNSKDSSCFSKNVRSKDGLYCYCKECHKQILKENEQQIKERNRRHYLAHREERLRWQKRYAETHKEQISVYGKAYQREYFKKTQHTVGHRYKAYKGDAKRRSFEFHLSFEEFSSFWQQPCEYCGATIDTIGIDRKDNSGHYNIDNCVSCCRICNFAKGQMSFTDWQVHLIQVAAFVRHRITKWVERDITPRELKKRYANYQNNARRKGIEFALDWEGFLEFKNKPCEYCGIVGGNVGIDRVDNRFGYKTGNCVSCCSSCNSGKNNRPSEEWASWLSRIAERYH